MSDDEQVLRASSVRFGQYPCLASLANIDAAVDAGVQLALAKKLAVPRKKVQPLSMGYLALYRAHRACRVKL